MTKAKNKIQIINNEDAPQLDVFGGVMRILSDGENLSPVVLESWVPPGRGVPMHMHDRDDELFYVLEGEITVAQQTNETVVAKGGCVQLPHGIPHAFRNVSSNHARILVTLTPGLECLEMFRAFDNAGKNGSAPEPARIAEIAAQHGVTFIKA